MAKVISEDFWDYCIKIAKNGLIPNFYRNDIHAWGHLDGGREGVKIILSIWHFVWQYYMGVDVHLLTLLFIFGWPTSGAFSRWLIYMNNKTEIG